MNPSSWFVCSQPNPSAETRLFLFPYAGGGPAVFGRWFADLPDNIEAWVAHYPGRGSRYSEPPFKELDTLVERLSEAIQPLLDRPFAFFGHSMGGLITFELARHLQTNHLPPPVTLFVSGCGAPQLPDPHPPIHSLAGAEFFKALEQLNGFPSELLQLPDAMETLLPILRADFQVVENYCYTPDEFLLDIPIIAYGGLDDPRVNRERLEGWASQTNASFKSIFFPGDHFFINDAKDDVMRSIAEEIMSSPARNRRPA